jgi:AcrR family transcriptional regulator
MARRSDHTRDELAALVVEAARAIVAAEGTQGVTMRRIAAEIGYSPGSIYNAVGDLEAVMRRMNAATLEGLVECLEKVISNLGTSATTIETAQSIAAAYVDYVIHNGRLWAALLERPPQPGEPVLDCYAVPRARLIEIVAASIAPLFPDGAVRQRAVVALWAALQGVASLAIGGNFQFIPIELNAADVARSIVSRYLTGSE